MKVFLSHAAADRLLADEVAKVLEAEGISVWHAGDIEPGDDPYKTLSRELETADAMVILLTANTAASPWMRHELEYALSMPQYSKKVFPLLFGETDDEYRRQVPWILKHLKPFEVSENGQDEAVRDLATVLKHAY